MRRTVLPLPVTVAVARRLQCIRYWKISRVSGARRRRALLTHFGGIQGVRKAGIEELSGIPGINRQLAGRIFKALH